MKTSRSAGAILKVFAAIAALMSAGAGHAQSNVSLFGTLDLDVEHGSGSVSSKTALASSGNSSSRLGFAGTEDLGAGLRAGFWLEAGLVPDDGRGVATNTNNQASGGAVAGIGGGQGLTFNRRSSVSLGGNWGEIRLGRDYAPSYLSLAVYDPWANLAVGTSVTYLNAPGGVTQSRVSNSVQYLYGHKFNEYARGNQLEGFHAAISYYMGENSSGAATSHDGNGISGRVGYNSGPLTVAVGLGRVKYAAGDIRQGNIGASYDFGVAKVMGHYASDKFGTFSGKGFLLGALVPMGPHTVRFAYSTYKQEVGAEPTAKKLAVGYIYNLSKRSSLYASFAHVNNSGGAAIPVGGAVTGANRNSSGYDIGITHSF